MTTIVVYHGVLLLRLLFTMLALSVEPAMLGAAWRDLQAARAAGVRGPHYETLRDILETECNRAVEQLLLAATVVITLHVVPHPSAVNYLGSAVQVGVQFAAARNSWIARRVRRRVVDAVEAEERANV